MTTAKMNECFQHSFKVEWNTAQCLMKSDMCMFIYEANIIEYIAGEFVKKSTICEKCDKCGIDTLKSKMIGREATFGFGYAGNDYSSLEDHRRYEYHGLIDNKEVKIVCKVSQARPYSRLDYDVEVGLKMYDDVERSMLEKDYMKYLYIILYM